MFKHLLLPLDGTAMAERVIPVARGLAQASDARITLLHVLEVQPERKARASAPAEQGFRRSLSARLGCARIPFLAQGRLARPRRSRT